MIKQDDELDKLEEDIRKLKNKYDQFFSGITKIPPMQDRRNVEIFIHEMNKQKMRDNARRFRFNTVVSRFNQYREMWGRKMREREEGPLEFKRRKAAIEEVVAPPPPPPPPRPSSSQPVTSPGTNPYVKMVAGSNGDAIEKLYSEIERENQKLGKRASMTMDQLRKMVEQQSEVVRERYKVDAVGFRVDVVDGKVKLKAKPLQEKG